MESHHRKQSPSGKFFDQEQDPAGVTVKLPGPALLRMAVVSDVVRQAREELGISRADLAARTGLCESDIAQFETDDPGWLRVGELALLLHVIGCRLEVSAVWNRPDQQPPAVLKPKSNKPRPSGPPAS